MAVLSEFLKRVPAEHCELINEIDSMIREAAPDLVVSMKWNNPTYHSKRNACSIISHEFHVNLQVWGGAEFEDPKGLLSGTGKGMRHIQFVPGAKIVRSAVLAIIKQAAKAARA